MNYYFYLGWKPEEFKDYTNYNGPMDAANGKCIEWSNKEGQIIKIWTKRKTDLGSLMHECIHAAVWTLQNRGVLADWDNDEPLTYLAQEIFEAAIDR